MTTSTFYFNLVKILTMAFVLGFCAYIVKANEVVMDIGPFQTCADEPVLSSSGQQAGKGIISVAVLNPDLSNFDSVKLAVVEIADIEVVADYLSYSLKDINHDDKTDMVFYFSSRDLIPPYAASDRSAHEACFFVDIMKKDNSITDLNFCENGFVLARVEKDMIMTWQ